MNLNKRIEFQFILVREHLKENVDVKSAMSDMALLVQLFDEFGRRHRGVFLKIKMERLWKMLMRKWGKV